MKAPRYSLRQLAYFVTIAESPTLSRAAEQLHVSQSALSQSLTDLEKSLGAQLCVRKKSRGITLTPTGSQVLAHARRLLRQADELQRDGEGGESLSGFLALGCFVTLAPTELPPLVHGFSELHPALQMQYFEGTQDVVQRQLLSGVLDLAVLYDMELDPELDRIVLHTIRPHILLHAGHHMADRPAVSLKELGDEPMVLLDAPPSAANTLRILQAHDVRPRVAHRPQSLELARSLVARGSGFALMMQRPRNESSYEGRPLITKEILEPVESTAVLLAWPRAAVLNQRAAEFAAFCRRQYADRPGRDRALGPGRQER